MAGKSRESRKKELLAAMVPLTTELRTIEEEEAAELAAKKQAHGKFLLAHIDFLLEMVPDHSYSDCNDKKNHNFHKCGRCKLIELREQRTWRDDWPFDDVEVKLEFQFH